MDSRNEFRIGASCLQHFREQFDQGALASCAYLVRKPIMASLPTHTCTSQMSWRLLKAINQRCCSVLASLKQTDIGSGSTRHYDIAALHIAILSAACLPVCQGASAYLREGLEPKQSLIRWESNAVRELLQNANSVRNPNIASFQDHDNHQPAKLMVKPTGEQHESEQRRNQAQVPSDVIALCSFLCIPL